MPSPADGALDLPGVAVTVRPVRRSRAKKKAPGSTWSLVAFGAQWCAPWPLLCKEFDVLEAEGTPVQRVDVDETPTLAERYRIITLPTVVVLRDGEERRRILGAVSLTELRAHVTRE